jgi:hypothetical protein
MVREGWSGLLMRIEYPKFIILNKFKPIKTNDMKDLFFNGGDPTALLLILGVIIILGVSYLLSYLTHKTSTK